MPSVGEDTESLKLIHWGWERKRTTALEVCLATTLRAEHRPRLPPTIATRGIYTTGAGVRSSKDMYNSIQGGFL